MVKDIEGAKLLSLFFQLSLYTPFYGISSTSDRTRTECSTIPSRSYPPQLSAHCSPQPIVTLIPVYFAWRDPFQNMTLRLDAGNASILVRWALEA